MTKKTLIFSFYYGLILAVVGWKVIDTLFTGSVIVAQKITLQDLANKQQILQQQQRQLSQELHQAQSLALVGQEATSNFELITNPVIIDESHFVALR